MRPAIPEVVFEEIECRSALSRVARSATPEPLWALDPYRDCGHAPNRCARFRSHDCLGRHAGPISERRVIVKTNVVEVARRELSRPDWKREAVVIGAVSDPYQRAELKYGLTRGVIRAFRDHASPCCVVTGSPLVLRDLPVLQELASATKCAVVITIPTLDDGILRHIEPHGASFRLRLEAIARLADAGVSCGAAITPVIPGLTDGAQNADAVEQAARGHGAGFVGDDALQAAAALQCPPASLGPGSDQRWCFAPPGRASRRSMGQLELAL